MNEGSSALKEFGVRFGPDFAAQADKFNDSITLMKVNTQQFGVDVIGGALPALNDVAAIFVELGKNSEDSSKEVSILGETVRQLGVITVVSGEAIAAAFDLTKLTATELLAVVIQISDQLRNLGYIGQAALKALSGDFSSAGKSLTAYAEAAKQDFKTFLDVSGQLGQDYFKRTEDRAKRTIDIVSRLEKGSTIFGDGKSSIAPDIKKPKPTRDIPLADDASLESAKNKIQSVRDEVEKLKETYELEKNAVNLSTAEYEKQKIEIEENLRLKKELQTIKDPGQAAELKNATNALIEQKKALIDLKEEQKQSFGQGAKEAIKSYAENISDVASQTKKLFTNAFQGMEDAFVKFVQTGKLNFADLAKSIEADLIRIAYRQLVVKTVLGAFGVSGFADGGVMTSDGPMPLKRYANGGIANSPQLAMFGEGSGPEAFVPLPDGRSIPVTMKGQSGGSAGDTKVVVNVNIANGDSQQDSKSQNQQGKNLGTLIAAAVKSTIINEQRPGGLLAAT